jgi:hypothetical protein
MAATLQFNCRAERVLDPLSPGGWNGEDTNVLAIPEYQRLLAVARGQAEMVWIVIIKATKIFMTIHVTALPRRSRPSHPAPCARQDEVDEDDDDEDFVPGSDGDGADIGEDDEEGGVRHNVSVSRKELQV